MSQPFPNMGIHYLCALQSVKFMVMVSRICILFAFFGLFFGFNIDLSQENERDEIEKLSRKIPVFSEYASSLESHVKLRYLQKISVVGIDPVKIL